MLCPGPAVVGSHPCDHVCRGDRGVLCPAPVRATASLADRTGKLMHQEAILGESWPESASKIVTEMRTDGGKHPHERLPAWEPLRTRLPDLLLRSAKRASGVCMDSTRRRFSARTRQQSSLV